MARRLTCAGTCMGHRPRPSGAPSGWLHNAMPYSCLLIPAFLTACHRTTIWAEHYRPCAAGPVVPAAVLCPACPRRAAVLRWLGDPGGQRPLNRWSNGLPDRRSRMAKHRLLSSVVTAAVTLAV